MYPVFLPRHCILQQRNHIEGTCIPLPVEIESLSNIVQGKVLYNTYINTLNNTTHFEFYCCLSVSEPDLLDSSRGNLSITTMQDIYLYISVDPTL